MSRLLHGIIGGVDILIVIDHVKKAQAFSARRYHGAGSREQDKEGGESDGTTEEPSCGSTGALGWEEGWYGASGEADASRAE